MDITGLYSRVLAVSRPPELRPCGGELVHPPARVHAVHLVVLHLLRREHRRLVVHDAPASINIICGVHEIVVSSHNKISSS